MSLAKPKKTKKPSRPTRDEFELEELANAVNEAHEERYEVILTIWQKESVRGKIVKLDGQSQSIFVESGIDTLKILFKDILEIKSASQ